MVFDLNFHAFALLPVEHHFALVGAQEAQSGATHVEGKLLRCQGVLQLALVIEKGAQGLEVQLQRLFAGSLGHYADVSGVVFCEQSVLHASLLLLFPVQAQVAEVAGDQFEAFFLADVEVAKAHPQPEVAVVDEGHAVEDIVVGGREHPNSSVFEVPRITRGQAEFEGFFLLEVFEGQVQVAAVHHAVFFQGIGEGIYAEGYFFEQAAQGVLSALGLEWVKERGYAN